MIWGNVLNPPRLEEILGKVKPYSEIRGPILQVAVTKRMSRIVTMETYNPCLDVNFRIPIWRVFMAIGDIQVRLVSDCRAHRSQRKITYEAIVIHSPERPTDSLGTGLLQPLGYRQCQTNCRAKFRPKITFVEGGMRLMASKKEGP